MKSYFSKCARIKMLVPWSYLKSWSCLACGHCCKDYAIPLAEHEWLCFRDLFGSMALEQVLDKKCLRRGPDGRCIFQYKLGNHWLCGIQSAKPLACRLFPFKVCFQPLFGKEEGASFKYFGKKVFVYADAECRGIEWGNPGTELVRKIIPEFIRLKLDGYGEQFYSTAHIQTQNPMPPVRSIFSACTKTLLPLAVIA
jgi:Fe-S-cluster containining protein